MHVKFGKFHYLLFKHSNSVTYTPLELVHYDLWGSSPISSILGYNYYISSEALNIKYLCAISKTGEKQI